MTLHSVLLQATSYEKLEALRQQFNRPGKGAEFILALLAMAAVVALVLLLYSFQRRRAAVDLDDPGKLFRRLLQRLGLSVPQCDVLRRMSADLRLDHPTVLLLGEGIFRKHSRRWLENGRRARSEDDARVEELARVLFAARAGVEETPSA